MTFLQQTTQVIIMSFTLSLHFTNFRSSTFLCNFNTLQKITTFICDAHSSENYNTVSRVSNIWYNPKLWQRAEMNNHLMIRFYILINWGNIVNSEAQNKQFQNHRSFTITQRKIQVLPIIRNSEHKCLSFASPKNSILHHCTLYLKPYCSP